MGIIATAKASAALLYMGVFTLLCGIITCLFEPKPTKAKVNTKENAYEEQYATLTISTNRSELFRSIA